MKKLLAILVFCLLSIVSFSQEEQNSYEDSISYESRIEKFHSENSNIYISYYSYDLMDYYYYSGYYWDNFWYDYHYSWHNHWHHCYHWNYPYYGYGYYYYYPYGNHWGMAWYYTPYMGYSWYATYTIPIYQNVSTNTATTQYGHREFVNSGTSNNSYDRPKTFSNTNSNPYTRPKQEIRPKQATYNPVRTDVDKPKTYPQNTNTQYRPKTYNSSSGNTYNYSRPTENRPTINRPTYNSQPRQNTTPTYSRPTRSVSAPQTTIRKR